MKDEKIISIEDRIPKLKKQRRKKAKRRLIFYLSLFFILISVIIYIQSPLSHVKSIEVVGNNFVDEEEIKKLSQIDEETNLWKIKLSDVASLVKENPFIKSAVITRKLPSTLSIEVEEYAVIGYVENNDSFYPVLENGKQIDYENRYMLGDAPLLLHFSDSKMLQTIAKQLNKLPDNILRLISEVHWTPESENKHKVELFMNDGYLVKGSIRNLADKMEVYPSIVAQLEPNQKGVIHLNVGAYFKQFSKEKN